MALANVAAVVARNRRSPILNRESYSSRRYISAVALAAQTDFLSDHADIQLELSHVLAAAGQVTEAHLAATRALGLYQRKGNLPGARESLRYLAQSAPA